MAASEDEMRKTILQECDADLAYIFEDGKLRLELQHSIVVAGYTSVKTLVGLEESRAGMRTVSKEVFGVDSDTPAGRLEVAKLLGIWETCKEHIAKETQIRAEARALGFTRPATFNEKTSMKKLVEARHGRIPTNETPSSAYVSEKLEEVENNEPVASTLDMVASAEDSEAQNIAQSYDSAGRVQMIKKRIKAKMPASPEEFRCKLRIEGNLWMMLSVKFPNKPYLRDLDPGVFAC